MFGQGRVFHALADFKSPHRFTRPGRDRFIDVDGHTEEVVPSPGSGKRFPDSEPAQVRHDAAAHLVAQARTRTFAFAGKERQDAPRTIRAQARENLMVIEIERTPAVNRNKTPVPHRHSCLGYRRAYSGRICG
jgi:hypothetical protein